MPRIISDPVDINSVDYYLINFNGNIQRVDSEKDIENNLARLVWELPFDLAEGEHEVRVAAGNEWGESEFSPPFLFTKEFPNIPTGIGLEFNTENV